MPCLQKGNKVQITDDKMTKIGCFALQHKAKYSRFRHDVKTAQVALPRRVKTSGKRRAHAPFIRNWKSHFRPRFRLNASSFLKLPTGELKHATFLSTRTVTGSDFAKKLTSHVTDVKSQTSKLPIWRLW